MFDRFKSKAAHTAKRAGLLSGGLLATLVGVAFLTVAAWTYLVQTTDALTAALVLGSVFTGVGLVVIGIASAQGDHSGEQATSPGLASANHQADHSSGQPPLMQAFLHGMQAGVSATQGRR